MKINNIFIFVIVLILFGCNRIDTKSLEVIEGIRLGTDKKNYRKQLDSLGINTETFYTKAIFSDFKEISNNQINVDVSDIFDLSDFRTGIQSHKAVLYPITIAGTDNVIGINAIVGHTNSSSLFNEKGFYNLTKENDRYYFNQNISIPLLEQIKNMLISKYGKAKYEMSFEYEWNPFYVLEGKQIQKYTGNEDRQGRITEWETEHLEISLFEGLKSIDAFYTKNGYETFTSLFGTEDQLKQAAQHNSAKGESPCVTYVYIYYQLKSETINALKLNEKKI